MSGLEILLLALGLAMDATAVAAARGLVAAHVGWRDALLVALVFGGFQAIMPLLGWILGAGIGPYIAAIDHWIAFAILALLGARMIFAGDEAPPRDAAFTLPALLVPGIATSIDALAAGVTLPLVDAPLAPTVAAIGLVTALLSAIGVVVGRRLGAHLVGRLDLVGGLVLIAIGLKILLEHLLSA